MAEKSSLFKGAPSSDDVAWGLESARQRDRGHDHRRRRPREVALKSY